MLPATLRAMPLDWNALDAMFDACPKRSHLEKAMAFVMVRIKATTAIHVRRLNIAQKAFAQTTASRVRIANRTYQ